jgi:hypothetical protein
MQRVPISKGKRFEIFARDGFTCQYCGLRPPDVILEVDHIEPVAGGGSNDDVNLITSCFDCNRGKRAKRLGDIRPRPDADIEYLKIEQERMEVQRYLDAKKARDKAFQRLVASLNATWSECLNATNPQDKQWRQWLLIYTPEEVEQAIHRVAGRYAAGRTQGGYAGLLSYISGILKRRREEEEAE